MVLETLWSASGISCQLPREVGLLADAVDWRLFSSPHRPWGVPVVRILNTVEVRYEHRTIHHHFAPAATVFKVLQRAVSKKGFCLDPLAAAKANLILPGADAPMPREAAVGKFVKPGHCVLTVDLTLKDFTNG